MNNGLPKPQPVSVFIYQQRAKHMEHKVERHIGKPIYASGKCSFKDFDKFWGMKEFSDIKYFMGLHIVMVCRYGTVLLLGS